MRLNDQSDRARTDSVAGGGVVLEGPPLDDWLAGRLEAHGVPLAGRVRRLQLEVLGHAAG